MKFFLDLETQIFKLFKNLSLLKNFEHGADIFLFNYNTWLTINILGYLWCNGIRSALKVTISLLRTEWSGVIRLLFFTMHNHTWSS